MKRLLNTLFVTTQSAYLAQEGETVLVRVEHETRLRVPIHTLGGIACFGQVSCSPPLLGLCGQRGVTVTFLTEHGRFLARVEGPVSGNVLLRRTQYRKADDGEASANMARDIVAGKIANCRTVLLRAAREGGGGNGAGQLTEVAAHLAALLKSLQHRTSVDTIRGIEGDAARAYFSVFDTLIVAQKDEFEFTGRNRRPPLDKTNALLSFLYTLLTHDMRGALETVGLDPAVGFLHRDRPGRPGLALDLIEELRPFLADRLALSLINRQQIKGKGFTHSDTGAIAMDDDTRKEVLVAYQKRKQEEIQHPFLNEKVPIGLLPHCQALLMARHVRGDLNGYPPFLWK